MGKIFTELNLDLIYRGEGLDVPPIVLGKHYHCKYWALDGTKAITCPFDIVFHRDRGPTVKTIRHEEYHCWQKREHREEYGEILGGPLWYLSWTWETLKRGAALAEWRDLKNPLKFIGTVLDLGYRANKYEREAYKNGEHEHD